MAGRRPCGKRSASTVAERARSLSAVGHDRSSSWSTNVSEEKILNTDLNDNDSDMFFEVCDAFERILKELNLTENSHRVQDKLTKIGNLINKKISLAKKIKRKSSDPLLHLVSLSVNDLSCSRQSLRSERYDSDGEGNPRFEKFMKEVNCPFCSEIQSDKISFVKHLDRSCSAYLKKEFKKEVHFPYAEFQILPNNLIKCNICPNALQQDLRQFHKHTQSQVHKHGYKKAAKVKNYVNRLFCACCKTLVYNNYTQIKGHIDQEAHKSKCENKKTVTNFLLNGIHFVFTESHKFKCLDCPPAQAVCGTPKSALEHLDNPNHKKHRKKNTLYSSAIYCEVCSVQVQLYEIITHFSSSQHCDNEVKLKEESFEVCFCCNFFCTSLLELSLHMESKCVKINNLRLKIPKESQQQINKSQEKKGNITKGPSITVKNCTKVPALYRYFTQFGEIATIEPHNDKDVVIEFREKGAVDDILLVKNVMVMEGTKLEIVTDLNSEESGKKTKPETETESKASDDSPESEDDADLGNGATVIQDGRLDELFARVSNYLMNTVQKLNSQEEIILQDCTRTLKTVKCHLVGFSGSGLSFPSETLSLFCEFLTNTSDLDVIPVPSKKSERPNRNLLLAVRIRLTDSVLWQNAEYGVIQEPYPYLECVHKDTQRACRLFVSESALVLTDMLRECMDKSELVKPFCLMVRFWLSVHELKIKDFDFVLISLLVFFLISVNVVALSEEKYKSGAWFYFLSKEQVEVFSASSWNLKLLVSVKELFQKFLQFVDSFDFKKYVICLPLRCPITKSAFNRGLFNLSDIKNTDSPESCGMHILDPVSLDNLVADIDSKHIKEFLKIVRATVKHFNIK